MPLRLFSHPDAKTLDIYLILQKDFRSAAAIARPRFGGQKFLFWHPAGTGIDPRSHLHRLHRLHFDSMMVYDADNRGTMPSTRKNKEQLEEEKERTKEIQTFGGLRLDWELHSLITIQSVEQ